MDHLEKGNPINPQTKQRYSICARIAIDDICSQLFCPLYCLCKTKNKPNDRNTEAQNPDISLQLGEGMILYLQMLKILTIMFFTLSVINLPVYLFFCQNAAISNQSQWLFSYFTLATLSETSFGCNYQPLILDPDCNPNGTLRKSYENSKKRRDRFKEKIELKCSAGSKISEILDFGLMNQNGFSRDSEADPGAICKNIENPIYEPMTWKLFLSETSQKIREGYEKEAAKKSDYTKDQYNPYNIDKDCNFQNIFHWKSSQEAMEKQLKEKCTGKASCLVDLESVMEDLSCDCRKKLKNADARRNLTVVWKCQAPDLTFFSDLISSTEVPNVVSKKLALTFITSLDLIGVIFMLWVTYKMHEINRERFEQIQHGYIQAQDFTVQIENSDLKHSKVDDIRIFQMKIWIHLQEILNDKKGDQVEDSHVIDINTTSYQFGNLNTCFEMSTILKKIDHLEKWMQKKRTNMRERDGAQAKIFQLTKIYEILKQGYKEQLKEKIQSKDQFKNVSKNPKAMNLENVFITFKNREFLYNNYAKLMDHKEGFNSECLHFHQAIDPQQINWQNVRQSTICQTRVKKCFSVLLFIGQIILMIWFNIKMIEIYINLENESDIHRPCKDVQESFSSDLAFKKHAYMSYRAFKVSISAAEKAKASGVAGSDLADISCYCAKAYTELPRAQFNALTFADVSDIDRTKYCQQWYSSIYTQSCYFQWFAYGYPLAIVVVNCIMTFLFGQVVKYNNYLKSQRESQVLYLTLSFSKILHHGFNFIIVTLAIPTIYKDQKLKGFDHQWYFRLGSIIALSCIINSLWLNLVDFVKYLALRMWQCRDRYYRCNLRIKSIGDYDQVNTACRTQEQVNRMYNGFKFNLEQAYASMTAMIVCIMLFSAGMPILYPIGFFFTFVTYWTNKFMCLHLYTRNLHVKYEVQRSSINIIIVAIVIHMLIGILQLSNISIQFLSTDVDQTNPNSYKMLGIDWTEFMSDQEILDQYTKIRLNDFKDTHICLYFVFIYIITFAVIVLSIYINKYGFTKPKGPITKKKFGSAHYDKMMLSIKKTEEKVVFEPDNSDEMNQAEIELPTMYLNEMNIKSLMNFYFKVCAEVREFYFIFEDHYIKSQVLKMNMDFPFGHQNQFHAKSSFEIDIEFRKEVCKAHDVTYEDSIRYEKYLTSRVKEVEKVIDRRLESVKTPIIDNQMKMISDVQVGTHIDVEQVRLQVKQKLQKQTYFEKLNILVFNQNLLLEANSKNMRMRGQPDFCQSQSYSLLSSKDLNNVSEVYYSIGADFQEEQDRQNLKKIILLTHKEDSLLEHLGRKVVHECDLSTEIKKFRGDTNLNPTVPQHAGPHYQNNRMLEESSSSDINFNDRRLSLRNPPGTHLHLPSNDQAKLMNPLERTRHITDALNKQNSSQMNNEMNELRNFATGKRSFISTITDTNRENASSPIVATSPIPVKVELQASDVKVQPGYLQGGMAALGNMLYRRNQPGQEQPKVAEIDGPVVVPKTVVELPNAQNFNVPRHSIAGQNAQNFAVPPRAQQQSSPERYENPNMQNQIQLSNMEKQILQHQIDNNMQRNTIRSGRESIYPQQQNQYGGEMQKNMLPQAAEEETERRQGGYMPQQQQYMAPNEHQGRSPNMGGGNGMKPQHQYSEDTNGLAARNQNIEPAQQPQNQQYNQGGAGNQLNHYSQQQQPQFQQRGPSQGNQYNQQYGGQGQNENYHQQ